MIRLSSPALCALACAALLHLPNAARAETGLEAGEVDDIPWASSYLLAANRIEPANQSFVDWLASHDKQRVYLDLQISFSVPSWTPEDGGPIAEDCMRDGLAHDSWSDVDVDALSSFFLPTDRVVEPGCAGLPSPLGGGFEVTGQPELSIRRTHSCGTNCLFADMAGLFVVSVNSDMRAAKTWVDGKSRMLPAIELRPVDGEPRLMNRVNKAIRQACETSDSC